MQKIFGFVLIFGLSLVSLSILSISAEPNTIPDWVKNNAKWWADGQIGESEFISTMQYLINQDIITIPVTHVLATDSNLIDDDRAMSIVVHYDGVIFGTGVTIYTYSEFQQLSSAIIPNPLGIRVGQDIQIPDFYLAGLPSKDKEPVYRLVDEFLRPTTPGADYHITVDVLTGDGTILQSWKYRSCELFEYAVYLETSKENYRFSDKDEHEFREVISWECAGYRLDFP